MANTLITPQVVTRSALRLLHEQLTFVRTINRQYDGRFAVKGAKIGDALDIRLPSRYIASDGASLVRQESVQEVTTMQVTSRKHVGLEFTTQELTMDLDELEALHLRPAMAVLAAAIEADCIARATKATFLQTGTWGSPPATLSPFLEARALLNQQLAPKDRNRNVLLSSMQSMPLVEGLKTLAQDETEISRQYREGYITRAAGFDWSESESMYSHARGTAVTGAMNATVTDNGTTTIALKSIGNNAVLSDGTVFTIAGVYAVHPETKAVRSYLQQFVVVSGGTANGSGVLTGVTVSPAINFTANGRQNVSAAPQADAVVTLFGTASQTKEQALVYHKDAFAIAFADLLLPRAAGYKAREVFDGISLRYVEDYEIDEDNCPARIDVLYGFKDLRPQHSVRVTS